MDSKENQDKVEAVRKILLKLTASRFWSDREAWAEITTREILKLFPEPVLTLSEARLPRHYWGGDTEVSMREECPFEDGKQAQLAHDQKTLRGNDEHKKV